MQPEVRNGELLHRQPDGEAADERRGGRSGAGAFDGCCTWHHRR